MKLNNTLLAAGLALSIASMAQAANQGQGKVNFTGSIIDAPCSIAPESADQTVALGQISAAALKKEGQTTPRKFEIKLENCDITTLKTVTTTFAGSASAEAPKLLAITGIAKGAGIALVDNGGKVITLGKATSPQLLGNGNSTLTFAAYLQGAPQVPGASGAKPTDAVIVPGDFYAVTDFTLDYQ